MFRNIVRTTLVAGALGLGFVASTPALALDNVKILVPANPGGGWDQTARALQAAMNAEGLAKKVTVDNKGGAGGTIGLAQFVNGAKGDGGATLVGGMVMVGAIATNKSPVNLTQVTPLARLSGETLVVVVPASSKIQTLKDLIEQFKASPGSVAWGGGSAGGSDHILAGLIAQAVGVEPAKVNYIAYSGGGEAQAAIMGGHVTAGISGFGEFQSQIKSGKLRALAVSGAERIPGESVPTLKEQGVNVEMVNWRSIFAAPGISEAQHKELVAALDKAVASTSWKEALKRNDWTDMYLAGPEFKKFLDADIARITKLVTDLGMVKP
ncbi:Bug family tripartite tricarboxylate transporter substrate binding protein [Aromatoleum petrolei]|uniref:Tripartite tricarboxylate transporter substrate binding protein n=1 Tax=Aromatoleum petrolei TaxID=76116 RepID=A0ABX1MNN6_9RHOO|nr:tripartite tricarboxylate transporter substrate-binding protein [Aromatoleum petrolei]NMF87930.1 tripartite tricarboxylate transporter substrate binding protein [Aromatoleum petrolei]QTQ36702.1 Putative tricarboxylic transport membrane protein [Aromatoleum petrolei]